MKQITINKVYICNFRSIKKECVNFINTPGLKLLTGENKVEERLGANGAGKTSFIKAIKWGFFGDTRVNQVMTWGEKTVEIGIDFNVNEDNHFVYRNGPPMKIELDTKVATQEDVDYLLGLTEERFNHSVLFGQGASLFPDLPIPERGKLLDDVLQLDIWHKAMDRATKKCVALEKDINEKNTALSFIEGKLSNLDDGAIKAQRDLWDNEKRIQLVNLSEQQKRWDNKKQVDLSSLAKQVDGWKETKQEELDYQIADLQKFETELALTESELSSLPKVETNDLEKDVKKKEDVLSKLKSKYTEADTNRRLIIKPRDFWIKNPYCPSCLQPITDDIRQDNLDAIDKEEQGLTVKLNELTGAVEEAKASLEKQKQILKFTNAASVQALTSRQSLTNTIRRYNIQIDELEGKIKKFGVELEKDLNPFKEQYDKLKTETNPFTSQLESEKKKVNPFIAILDSSKKERQTLTLNKKKQEIEIKKVQQQYISAEYWKHGFKRIRLYFVNQILMALQLEIQAAMSSLGLDKWAVTLSTESITKSETVKLGVQIHIKSPVSEGEWTSWSGGESQRLRLAIEMGLASLIQRASGCFFDFEFWDEPGQHLSEQGMEDLLEALRYRADTLNKTIFITHHSALVYSGFNEIWKAVKDNQGSHILPV